MRAVVSFSEVLTHESLNRACHGAVDDDWASTARTEWFDHPSMLSSALRARFLGRFLGPGHRRFILLRLGSGGLGRDVLEAKV